MTRKRKGKGRRRDGSTVLSGCDAVQIYRWIKHADGKEAPAFSSCQQISRVCAYRGPARKLERKQGYRFLDSSTIQNFD
jgi:hypothetical protein